jgi:hypothetical protein
MNAIFWDVIPCGSSKIPHGVTPQKTAFFIVTTVNV